MTQAMQRALDALLDGRPIPEEARRALSPAERAEIASLAATAVLTRMALHAPQPSPEAEESSLRGAQRHLIAPSGTPRAASSSADAGTRPGLLDRLMRRWRGKG